MHFQCHFRLNQSNSCICAKAINTKHFEMCQEYKIFAFIFFSPLNGIYHMFASIRYIQIELQIAVQPDLA